MLGVYATSSYLCVTIASPNIYLFIEMAAIVAKVPDEALQEWEEQGNAINLITRFLGLGENIIHAVLEELGLSTDDHIVSIAYVMDEEWEDLLTNLAVNGGST